MSLDLAETKTLHALRLDPCSGTGEVRIKSLRLSSSDGTLLKTQAEAQSAPFQLACGDWQELTATIPAGALPGVIRVHLRAQQQAVEVDSIEIHTTGKPRRRDF